MSQNVELPENLYCSKSHEYVKVEGNNAFIGISQYAADQLGEIVYIELPDVDTTYAHGEVFGKVEAVKAAEELYMPIGGKVIETNERLVAEPELINDACYTHGWIAKITDFNLKELDELLSMEDYLGFIEE